MFSNYPDVLNVEQVMDMLHIGKVLAYRLLADGTIKSVKIGRQYKIAKKHVIDYFTEKTEENLS